MKQFVEGDDRKQIALPPECVDDYIGVDELDLADLGAGARSASVSATSNSCG